MSTRKWELISSNSIENEKEPKKICSIVLNKDYVEKFNYAVDNHYWYQLYLDDLPMWAMVGGAVKKDGTNEIVRYMYTHQKFSIGYNGPNVCHILHVIFFNLCQQLLTLLKQ